MLSLGAVDPISKCDDGGAEDLTGLFPDADYEFHLTLRRGEPQEFFGVRDPAGRVLAERARWIREEPQRYAALQPEGAPLLGEFSAMAGGWCLPPFENVQTLATSCEPDVLLLSPDADGEFRLRGGALCFPTAWALEDKIGRRMEVVHAPVPGLNQALGALRRALRSMSPELAEYKRINAVRAEVIRLLDCGWSRGANLFRLCPA